MAQPSSSRHPQVMKAPDQLQLSVFDDFEASAAEKKLARDIFELTDSGDPEKDSGAILLGERAVPLFETSGLPSVVLGEIWNVCDELQGGFLTLQGLCLALRLMAHAQKHMDDGKPFPAEREDLVRLDWFTPINEKVHLDALADAPRARPLPRAIFAPPKNGGQPQFAPPPGAPPPSSYLPPPGPPPDQHRRSVSAPTMPDAVAVPRASTPSHDYLALETSEAEKPAFLIRTPSLTQHRASASTSSLVVPSASFPSAHSSPSSPLSRSPSFTPSPSFQRPSTFASTSSLNSAFIHAPTGPIDPFADPTPLPPLTDAQKTKYLKLWGNTGGAPGGTLDGETCRATFVKSRLGFAVLGKVWSLATGDAPEDSPMHAHQFVLAMYLIEGLMSRTLAPDKLPARLPESLVVAAGGPRADPHALGRAAFRRASPSPSRMEQDQTDAERAFARLDASGAGKLDGGVLLAYFMKSGLSVEVLAEIWDEADVNKDGWLTTVEFARAFGMVRARVPTFDQDGPLPPSSEPSLIAFDGEDLAARARRSMALGPSLLDQEEEEDERERDLPPLPTFAADARRRQMSLPPPPLPPRESPLPSVPQQVPLPPSPAPLVPQMTGMTVMSEPPPAYTPEAGAGERPVEVDEQGVVTPGQSGR
ncbi:hypothetical protein AURDEDRAFT_166043 [Auricularia subglabra TFB-10046 SS5]|nr:hypothetical protein AURDEDRAFT_166043 [Auricularia subglabra TFB-10046 SS5]